MGVEGLTTYTCGGYYTSITAHEFPETWRRFKSKAEEYDLCSSCRLTIVEDLVSYLLERDNAGSQGTAERPGQEAGQP